MPDVPNYVTNDDLDARNYATVAELDRRDYVTVAELDRRDYVTRAMLDDRTKDILNAIEHVRTSISRDVASMIDTRFLELSTALRAELGQLFRAILPDVRDLIKAVDEKYADLPARVTALENR
ncbi:hypothetical protein BH11MYX1_BH11MYX1_01080 [soil metagenome]